MPTQRTQGGDPKESEGDDGGDRISGEAQDGEVRAVGPWETAQTYWTARTHPDPPEVELSTELEKDSLYEVRLSHGRPACRDQEVCIPGGFEEAASERLPIITRLNRGRDHSP
jgi:hypothetical protein